MHGSLSNGQLTSRSGYLPNEVLSNIFQECLELDDLECSVPSPLSAPLVLTWVCRLWRTVALNTSRLWDGITLVRSGNRVGDSTQLLKLWIKRSGSLSFGVRLYNNRLDDDDEDAELKFAPALIENLRALVDTVLTCSKRWRVLEAVLPDMSFATPLMDAVTADARGLEYFCISLWDLGNGEPPLRYDFSQNKALREVRINTPLIIPFPNAPGAITTTAGNNGAGGAFENLTVLELQLCPSTENCLAWLDLTPNLESLVLRILNTAAPQTQTNSHPGDGSQMHVRRLSNLESLEIACFSAMSQQDNPVLMLDALELPSLTDLEIDLMHIFDESCFRQVRDLLVRSDMSLERLALSGVHVAEGEIVELLRMSPELEWFECEIVSDAILRALTPRLITTDAEGVSRPPESASTEEGRTDGNNITQPDETTSISETKTRTGTEIQDQDTSKYTILCPNLSYFEPGDIDACSLQVLYEMMASRCQDVYKDIQGFVDTSAVGVRPTPEEFKTLISIVLPCDPVYGLLSHPEILESMDRAIYF